MKLPILNITFKNNKLEKCCNSLEKAQRKWGTSGGKLVLRRLDDIKASKNLLILKSLPIGRCHPLKGDLKGQWSIDVKHPYRLLFELVNILEKDDESIDLEKIDSVKILRIENTHG